MSHDKKIDWLLRIGVAFAFLYPAISAIFNPFAWIGYFPESMFGIVSGPLLLLTFGIVEIIIALWILSGKKIFIPSVLATIMLLAIVAFNYTQMDILFRDLSIAAMALVLAINHRSDS